MSTTLHTYTSLCGINFSPGFKNSEKWQEVKGSDINDENIWKQLTQQAYFAILNVAVGHNIGGEHNPDDQTASGFENGAAMIVNYVKFKIKDA